MSVAVSTDDIPTLTYTPQPKTVSPEAPRKHYENNTYIDWSYESLVTLESSLFQTRKWAILVILSLLVGYITAFIDLIAVWLNDLKKGLCLSKIEKWSLLNPYSTCPVDDWYDWLRLFFNSTSFVWQLFVNFPIYLLFAAIWTFIVAYIAIFKDGSIIHSGIPEIKLIISGFNYRLDEYLGLRTLLYKIAGLILVVSSGLWLGKEGPLVHVSAAVLSILYSVINKDSNEAIRRELLSAATATGISVAFSAPIGGVLFVLESMPTFFMPTKIMWNSFVTATLAVVAMTGLKLFTEGQNFFEQELFLVQFGNFSWIFVEVIPFISLGILGGVYGHYFTKLNSTISNQKFRLGVQHKLCSIFNLSERWGKLAEIMALLVITTLLNFPIEITKLPLLAYLKILFTDCPEENLSNSSNFMCSPSNGVTSIKLLFIIIQGFVLSAYTFAVELPGGILMPSLVLGATSGRLLGIISQAIQNKVNFESMATCTAKSCIVSPSSYAVIGAASFMSGITKLTMSVVVIMFELTGAVTYVLPIMLAVMISKFVNDWLRNDNIYDTWTKQNFNRFAQRGDPNEGKGHGLVSFSGLTSKVKNRLPDVKLGSIMVPVSQMKCLCLVPDQPYTASHLVRFAADDTHEGYPLILSYSTPVALGYVAKQELSFQISALDNEDPVSFQVSDLPSSVLSKQLHYEQGFESLNQIRIRVEKPLFIFNDLTPVIVVLEAFEKLYMNYLVIVDASNKNTQHMAGFVDRFSIANLIDLKFDGLQDEYVPEFDIENEEEHELLERGERLSIELIR